MEGRNKKEPQGVAPKGDLLPLIPKIEACGEKKQTNDVSNRAQDVFAGWVGDCIPDKRRKVFCCVLHSCAGNVHRGDDKKNPGYILQHRCSPYEKTIYPNSSIANEKNKNNL